MFVTVAICTFNRAESLRRTLNSLIGLRIPKNLSWELIIINNNSTDHTDEVISDYSSQLPLRRAFEPKPGLSHARNRVVDLARGNYIVWTDDDVVVDPRWLQAYSIAFHRWPEAALFGGRIFPEFEASVPRWIKRNEKILGGAFAVVNFSAFARPLSMVENLVPFGANFAVRLAEQRKFRYNPELGAAPGRLRSGEESEVICRILNSGSAGYWVPEAIVHHCIGKERTTFQYIFMFFRGQGETAAVIRAANAERFWAGVPLRLWLQLPLFAVSYYGLRLACPWHIWARLLRKYAYTVGMFEYWWQKRNCARRMD
jgi:glycosyltransferase involved in cell wall biosynthesis